MSDVAGAPRRGRNQFLDVLRAVERYALPDLVMHQARRLETLVRHARANVPFYADRLARVFDPDDVLDLGRWLDVPVLTADEARAGAAAMRARSVPDFAGEALADQTSGTGGSAFHFVRSAAALAVDAANSLRIYDDYCFDKDARFGDLRIDVNRRAQYPEGALRPSWAFGEGGGDYAVLDINTPLPGQIEWLLRTRPAILFTWAMNARAIALELEARGESLPLSAMATSAEACTDGVRRDCRRVFGADPVDIVGAREIGVLAWRCHQGPSYHLAAEGAFIEVIAESGAPAVPGETGLVVATSLYNFHMPFIRYSTGDYVTLGHQGCPCGRTLPTLTAFKGRGRNRLGMSDGRRVFPVIPEAALDAAIGPLRWQLRQADPEQIDVAVEPDAMSEAQASFAEVARAVREAFGAAFAVRLVAATPPEPGVWRKKRELFRSLLDQAPSAPAPYRVGPQ